MEKLDEELVLEYIEGDESALDILFKRYKKPILNFSQNLEMQNKRIKIKISSHS